MFVINDYTERNIMIKNGNIIINKIDSYKQFNNHLPTSIEEIGIKETLDGPFFYDLVDSTTYEISFGVTFGESAIYNSSKKQWSIP